MNKENCASVTVKGNSFSIKQKVKKRLTNNENSKETEVLTPERILLKKRNRSIKNLIREFSNIKSKAHIFASLSFDRRGINENEIDIKAEKEALNCFLTLFCKEFPHGWALYKCEWSVKNKLHFHLALSLGSDIKKVNISKYNLKLSRLWKKANNNYNFPNGYQQKAFIPICHYSYITAKEKLAQDMVCMRKLNGSKLWGVRNRKNIEKHPSLEYKLNNEELDNFKECIEIYHELHSTSSYYKNALTHSQSTLDYIPKEIIIRSVRMAKLMSAISDNQLSRIQKYISHEIKKITSYEEYRKTLRLEYQDFVNFFLLANWENLFDDNTAKPQRSKLILKYYWDKIPTEIIFAYIQAAEHFYAIVEGCTWS